jgi:hypothetical protein
MLPKLKNALDGLGLFFFVVVAKCGYGFGYNKMATSRIEDDTICG